MTTDCMKFYRYHNIREVELGKHTPWPNRAEAGVKVYQVQMGILIDSLFRLQAEMPTLAQYPVRLLLKKGSWARNLSVTNGGKCTLEIAYGRKPPNVYGPDNMLGRQLVEEPSQQQQLDAIVQKEAIRAPSHPESYQVQ